MQGSEIACVGVLVYTSTAERMLVETVWLVESHQAERCFAPKSEIDEAEFILKTCTFKYEKKKGPLSMSQPPVGRRGPTVSGPHPSPAPETYRLG